MDLRQIRHFLAVAEQLSFRKAAESLHTAQPPLSVSIRRLEEELGAALFVRNRRGVKLSDVGQAVLNDARNVMFHVEQLRRSAIIAVNGLSGTLRVGFIGSATYTLLPRLLPVFARQYPNITLELHESTTITILADIEAGKLDLGLIRYPVLADTDATLVPVEWDTLVLALPPDSPLCKRKRLTLSDLSEQPFILYSSTFAVNLRSQVMLACQAAGFVPKVVQEAVQIQTIISLVESGLGVALVPSISQNKTGKVVFRHLADSDSHLSIATAVAWRASNESATTKRFRDILFNLSPTKM
ncbi:MAG TPA: LysR substrate-binding domain-containing protein [Eoetvoesiella sp.]